MDLNSFKTKCTVDDENAASPSGDTRGGRWKSFAAIVHRATAATVYLRDQVAVERI
jgi:hypothetical protein